MVWCRNAMEMHWHLLCGWPTRPSCFTSSVVTWTSLAFALKPRMCWLSACSMHSCCLSIPCRMVFIIQCLLSSVPILKSTVLWVKHLCRYCCKLFTSAQLSAEPNWDWANWVGFNVCLCSVMLMSLVKHVLVEDGVTRFHWKSCTASLDLS